MGIIPGWLLARILFRRLMYTPEEMGIAAAVFSIPLTILARVIAGTLNISGISFVIAWALLCAVTTVIISKPEEQRSPPDPLAWLIAIGLALTVILPAAVNPSIRSWGDAMFHAQIVHEILPRNFPAEDPAYFGISLHYIWVFHIWAAAMVDAMGVTAYAVFVWINGTMMAALSLGVYRLASLYWPRLLYRRLAAPIVVLGMNALGWLGFIAYTGISTFVGERKGMVELEEAYDLMLGNPTANTISTYLIHNAHYNLSSFLYKYLCANCLATALTIIVAAFIFASLFLKHSGWSRIIAFALCLITALIIHPIVGIPAASGFILGFLFTCLISSIRIRSLLIIAIIVLLLLLAAPWFDLMTGQDLGISEKGRFHPSLSNVPGLIQGLLVVIIPGLWGWWKLRQRQKVLAYFGAGFGLAVLASAIMVDFHFKMKCEIYIVYIAYLSIAFFATGGIAAAITALSKRGRRVFAWMIMALLFLPSSILMVQGFARDSRGPGSHGYPETPDEIAVFEYILNNTPLDAIVLDSQISHHSPCSAYSHRSAFYGGYFWAEMVGYPKEEVNRRERVIINLFFEPDVSDSTWSILRTIGRPVYIVARDRPPYRTMLRGLPDVPVSDTIKKLQSFSKLLKPAFTTPTIVLFRYEALPKDSVSLKK